MSEPTPDAISLMHIYWSLVSLLLGACIGSFLNVVIYRWSHGLSIVRPSRSFCPHCRSQLRWHDNVPLVSYILLAGRCRACRRPISLQYPFVELATAMLFFMTYDLFFVARQRVGIGTLETDWPLLLAHWALWAGMLVMAVMDLETYSIDIRPARVVAIIGIAAHTFWTPVSSASWIRPGPAGAAMVIAATVGLVMGALLFLRRVPMENPEPDVSEPAGPDASAPETASRSRLKWLGLLIPLALVLGYLLWVGTAGPQAGYASPPVELELESPQAASPPLWQDSGAIRLLVAFFGVFVALTLAASRPQPQADREIVEAIHAEAVLARPLALWELRLISPAVILGATAVFAVRVWPAGFAWVDAILHWQPVGTWQPVWGLSTGLSGWIIGGGIGWIARIFFTLLFGKEALGMGDIHILAAAGAVAGWPVTLLGFFAAAFLTLAAVLVIQVRRQSRAVAYVPWLALAFLLCCMFQDRVLDGYGIRPFLAAPVSSWAGAVNTPMSSPVQMP